MGLMQRFKGRSPDRREFTIRELADLVYRTLQAPGRNWRFIPCPPMILSSAATRH